MPKTRLPNLMATIGKDGRLRFERIDLKDLRAMAVAVTAASVLAAAPVLAAASVLAGVMEVMLEVMIISVATSAAVMIMMPPQNHPILSPISQQVGGNAAPLSISATQVFSSHFLGGCLHILAALVHQ